MRTPCTLFLAIAFLVGLGAVCEAQTPQKPESFPAGIVLIGTKTLDAPNACGIQVISSTGEHISTLFRRAEGSIFMGRFSREQDQLAFSYTPPDGKGEFWMIKAEGEATKIMEGTGAITSWSPDGKKFTFYQASKEDGSFDSFVLDLSSKMVTKLELPADYVAEDWHPHENIRTAIYMNPRNRLYRETKGDSYPTRQLDLLIGDKSTPVTKNPCTDNIWSRFSRNGDRIAYYGRRLVGEKSLEYAVVCSADGSQPREIFGFTEFGDAAGLPWFRPNGPPAWSPDGSTLAWLVSTNTTPTSEGEKLELLFTPVQGGKPRRVSLTEMGFEFVSAIEWR